MQPQWAALPDKGGHILAITHRPKNCRCHEKRRISANYDGGKTFFRTRYRHHATRREAGRSAESAKHTSPGQAALKACAALGSAPIMAVFLGPFGPSRRS